MVKVNRPKRTLAVIITRDSKISHARVHSIATWLSLATVSIPSRWGARQVTNLSRFRPISFHKKTAVSVISRFIPPGAVGFSLNSVFYWAPPRVSSPCVRLVAPGVRALSKPCGFSACAVCFAPNFSPLLRLACTASPDLPLKAPRGLVFSHGHLAARRTTVPRGSLPTFVAGAASRRTSSITL